MASAFKCAYANSGSAGLQASLLHVQAEPAKKASDWKEFTAPDGRKYYYNAATKVSSWTMPDELKKGSDTPSAVKASPAAHGTPSVQVHLLAELNFAALGHNAVDTPSTGLWCDWMSAVHVALVTGLRMA